jgi:hypothetical protein
MTNVYTWYHEETQKFEKKWNSLIISFIMSNDSYDYSTGYGKIDIRGVGREEFQKNYAPKWEAIEELNENTFCCHVTFEKDKMIVSYEDGNATCVYDEHTIPDELKLFGKDLYELSCLKIIKEKEIKK